MRRARDPFWVPSRLMMRRRYDRVDGTRVLAGVIVGVLAWGLLDWLVGLVTG